MMSAPLFLAILLCATTLWSPSHSVEDEYTRQQNKLKELCRELVLDADMKIRAVQYYRNQYHKSLQYQLGGIVYDIRDRFKRMVRKYQLVETKMAYSKLDHNNATTVFVEVRRLAVEIENQFIMLREWHYKIANPETLPLRSGLGRDYDESEELLREEAARGRIARAWGKRPTPPRRAPFAPGGSAKRKNKKWQYVRGYEFV